MTRALRALAGLFAVSWLVLPGFGLIDLAVTWSSDWPQVLEAGWGLFATAIVGAPLALVAAHPRVARTAFIQLATAAVALAVAALIAEEGGLWWFAAGLAAQVVVLRLLFSPVRSDERRAVSRTVLLVAAGGAVPWTLYALDMWAANREDRSDADLTIGVDHYSMQGALALVFATLPVLAAVMRELRPFTPVCVGVAAAYLGLVSLAWPDADAGFSKAWSLAAIAWGLTLAAVASAPYVGIAQRRRS